LIQDKKLFPVRFGYLHCPMVKAARVDSLYSQKREKGVFRLHTSDLL